jgi:hypothetical protein
MRMPGTSGDQEQTRLLSETTSWVGTRTEYLDGADSVSYRTRHQIPAPRLPINEC